MEPNNWTSYGEAQNNWDFNNRYNEEIRPAISYDKAKPMDYIKPFKAAGKLILNLLEITALAINFLYNNTMLQLRSRLEGHYSEDFYQKTVESSQQLSKQCQQLKSDGNRFIELIQLLAKGKKFTLDQEETYNEKVRNLGEEFYLDEEFYG